MRRENSSFQTAFLTEAGTFLDNQDYFAYVELDDLACWVLVDGMDADRETESAELAVKSVLDQFTSRPTLSRRRLMQYVKQAHKLLVRESRRVRRKASLALVATDYRRAVWVTAGHVRFYHFRAGKLLAQSKDHSLAQQLADSGRIRRQDVDSHPEKQNLLQYLGKPGTLSPFASKSALLENGDILLLCSQGLWEKVHSIDMMEAAEEAAEPAELVDMLEEILLSRQGKTIPNYTAAAVYARKVYVEEQKKRDWKKWVRTAAMILIPLVLFGGGAVMYKVRAAQNAAESAAAMADSEKNGDQEAQDGDFAKAMDDYSQARNAAIRIKDKVHAQLIADKLKLAELVVDGDGALKDGDYEKAVGKYEAAEKEAKSHPSFDMRSVEANKKKAQTYLLVLGMIKQGDLKLAAKDYTGAKDVYEKAHQQAVLANFTEGDQQIALKLNEVNSQMDSIQKGEQKAKGEDVEKQGDDLAAAEKYQEAMAQYNAAQGIYQQAGLLDKVLSVERKILEAQKKLTPASPAPGTPDGAAGRQAAGSGTAGGGAG